ncbi:MAG: hypothetical protein ACRDHK_05115 [Actinomycetota bacterium]
MIPELRRAYNAAYTDEKYRAYRERLVATAGCPVDFRVAESPIFLPSPFRAALIRSTEEILAQLQTPRHQRYSLGAVPAEFDVPGCDEHPLFAQVDFAVTRVDGALVPRLIELQGFPSLYGFQVLQALELRRMVPAGAGLSFLLSDLDLDSYRRVLGDVILGGYPPEHVVLFDLDPPSQKTYPDFAMTEKLWGIRAVCPTTVEKRGRELWYRRDEKATRILRIYNRVIVDELQAKTVELPFRYTDPLDVEWAGHPNWYFRWSKHSLPWLDHPAVPKAVFLSDLERYPRDLEHWVLKPLFSFAGVGVKVDVTAADLDAVPPSRRGQALLMQKVDYAPVIETADGNRSKCEVRIMVVWRDDTPLPVTTLVRLSQGKMMGVDFNKDRTWVGSSTSLWP